MASVICVIKTHDVIYTLNLFLKVLVKTVLLKLLPLAAGTLGLSDSDQYTLTQIEMSNCLLQ